MGAQGRPAPDAAATDVKLSSPLAALTMAALSLPAFAATQPAETSVSMGVSNYKEADIPRADVVAGDNRRYDIDIRQFRLLTPVGKRWSVNLGVSRENMSGASPWATVRGPDGEADLIMSGATIEDSRTEVNLAVALYGDGSSTAVALTRSEEDDYEADAASLSGEWAFNGDLTTLSADASYSSDVIEPSDAALFGRVTREERRTRSVSIGIAQVLDRLSALYAGVGFTDHRGYLSDPYKLRDVRPRRRLERTVNLRYRRYLTARDAAVHLDYRFYDDDWGIVSHTLQSSWYQNVGARFQIVPNLRYYTQSAADFLVPVDNFLLPPEISQSSDFRLSAYGAVTLGLKGILQLPRWALTLSVDRYRGREKYGLSSGAEHPARLDFTLMSLVVDFKF